MEDLPLMVMRLPWSTLHVRDLLSSNVADEQVLNTCPFFAQMMHTAAEGSPTVQEGKGCEEVSEGEPEDCPMKAFKRGNLLDWAEGGPLSYLSM